MAQGFKVIARVAKTRGIKGEVVAVPANGLPPVLSQGLKVAMVPPVLRGERWHEVLECESTETGQLIALSGITTTNDAHELVGKYLLAEASELEASEELDELEDLVGLEVIDERLGSLGRVSEILVGSVQDILVVESERGEVMIPMVDELIWYAEDEEFLESAIPVGLAPWDQSSLAEASEETAAQDAHESEEA